MIKVHHVFEAGAIRKQLEQQTSVITLFIFEHPSAGDGKSNPVFYLYAELHGENEPKLDGKSNFKIFLGASGSQLICPLCREWFSTKRFPVHIKKHKIQKLEITNSLLTRSEEHIQHRIDALEKPVLLPKFTPLKKKKKKRQMVFSAGAPGLGKKN